MKLSEYIRALRKRKELSQQDLADQIGVSKGYISRLESEKTYGRSKKHVPSISILNSLARAGGETLNDLLEQIEDMEVDVSTLPPGARPIERRRYP